MHSLKLIFPCVVKDFDYSTFTLVLLLFSRVCCVKVILLLRIDYTTDFIYLHIRFVAKVLKRKGNKVWNH